MASRSFYSVLNVLELDAGDGRATQASLLLPQVDEDTGEDAEGKGDEDEGNDEASVVGATVETVRRRLGRRIDLTTTTVTITITITRPWRATRRSLTLTLAITTATTSTFPVSTVSTVSTISTISTISTVSTV